MIIRISKQKINNIDIFLRRSGYARIFDRISKKTSYCKRLSGGLYPRFHIYPKEDTKNYIFSLHLDQKKASYSGQSAHSGEYDGELIDNEAKRLKQSI